jgi:hypothetical protein
MAGAKGKDGENQAKVDLETDLDALFQLPLPEFTSARNALAARLKKAGNNEDATRVKALSKPSVSAWAVNQLYWKHRGPFNDLIAAGQRFGRAHASQLSGKNADTREPLAERREALTGLLRLAGSLLREAEHNPAPDMMRRLTTTLEALSIYSLFSDGPSAGRLTEDLDPPGFESLAVLIPGVGRGERPDPSARAVLPPPPTVTEGSGKRTEKRQAKIASAKAALQAAERVLDETRTSAQDLEEDVKKAAAHADTMEKNRREAEERLEKARIAAEEARQRLHSMTVEAEKVARTLEDAERGVEKARIELNAQIGTESNQT